MKNNKISINISMILILLISIIINLVPFILALTCSMWWLLLYSFNFLIMLFIGIICYNTPAIKEEYEEYGSTIK